MRRTSVFRWLLGWLLGWLFPLRFLLPKARALGAVTFTEVAGVGWQCTIQPLHTADRSPRAMRLNSWRGVADSLVGALRNALQVAETKTSNHVPSPFAPKLGGAEFDDE